MNTRLRWWQHVNTACFLLVAFGLLTGILTVDLRWPA